MKGLEDQPEAVYAQLKGFHNDFDEMVACGERAVRLAEEAGEASLQLAARVPYVRALLWLARWDEALEVADQGLGLAGDDPSLGAVLFAPPLESPPPLPVTGPR